MLSPEHPLREQQEQKREIVNKLSVEEHIDCFLDMWEQAGYSRQGVLRDITWRLEARIASLRAANEAKIKNGVTSFDKDRTQLRTL